MAGLQVFVSYAGRDRDLALEVHGWLTAAGHQVFLGHHPVDGIAPGETWEQALHARLRGCDAMVCLLTSAYLVSTWCTAELAVARSRGTRILPITAEVGVRHPLLNSLQATDLAGAPQAVPAELARIAGTGRRGWPDDRSPFPGLRAFEADEHLVFFGRDADVDDIVRRLRSAVDRADDAALVVVGPSGCGKSSTVRAGVAPRLADEPGWVVLAPIVPGADPVDALCAALTNAGDGWRLAGVRDRVARGELGRLVNELLLADPDRPQRHLLVVVDQLEQLLTVTPDAERARFVELLRTRPDGPVRVLATLRPEFLDGLLADPALAGLPTAIHPLTPLGREALRLVIEGPAGVGRLTVSNELVATLVEDTGTGTALPLLAFTLARLAEGVPPGGELSAAAYRDLGGVAGALASRADDAVGPGGRDEAVAALLNLVTVDADGTAGRRPVPLDELPRSVRRVLDAFVDRRLLTTTSGTVTVAHDAFLAAWPPLRAAIASTAAAIRARTTIEAAADDWTRHGRARDRLWERGRLAAALSDVGLRRRGLRTTTAAGGLPVRLNPTARGFLDASVRRDVLLRSRLVATLSVLLLTATTLAGVAVDRSLRLDAQLGTARASILATASQARIADDPTFAAKLALSAWRSDPDEPAARDALLDAYLGLRSVDTAFQDLTGEPIDSVQATPDGRTVLLGHAGGATLVDDLLGPRRSTWPVPGVKPGASLQLSPGGGWLVAGASDEGVLVWDVQRRTGPVVLLPPGDREPTNPSRYHIAISDDDRRMLVVGPATGGVGQAAWLWDLDAGRRLETPPWLLDGGTTIGVWFTADPTRVTFEHADSDSTPTSRLMTRSLVDDRVRVVLYEGYRDERFVRLVDGGRMTTCVNRGGQFTVALADTATGAVRPTPVIPALTSCQYDGSTDLPSRPSHLLVDAPRYALEPGLNTARLVDFDTGGSAEFAMPVGAGPNRDGQAAADRSNRSAAVVLTADGELTVLVARGPALLALRSLTPIPPLAGASGRAVLRLADDGQHLIFAASVPGAASRTMTVLDRASGEVLGQTTLPQASYGEDAHRRSEVAVLVNGDDGWELARYALPTLSPITTHALPSGDLIPDHDVSFAVDEGLVVAVVAGTLTGWDARTSAVVADPVRLDDVTTGSPALARVQALPGHPGEVLVTVPGGPVLLWDVVQRRASATIPVVPAGRGGPEESFHDNVVTDASGSRVAVLTAARSIEVWDVDAATRTGLAPFVPDDHALLGFTADGDVVTRPEPLGERLELWDPARGELSGTITSSGIGYQLDGAMVEGTTLTVDSIGRVPPQVPLSAQAWADHLCRALPPDYLDRERQALPAVADAPTPC